MSEVTTGIGLNLAVFLGAPDTFDEAGFSAVGMVYDNIDGVVDAPGMIGSAYAAVTYVLLKDGVTKTGKGEQTFEPFTITVLKGTASTGRTTLDTAAADRAAEVSLKVTDGDGSIWYLCGVVLDGKQSGSSTNASTTVTYTVQPNYVPVPSTVV